MSELCVPLLDPKAEVREILLLPRRTELGRLVPTRDARA